jgi:transcriptional regulator with XRE-family HTH domain
MAPSTIDVHIGKRLRHRRKMLGLTQSRLAARLGVTYQQIQKYEGGLNRISAGRLMTLATILAVPVTFFYTGLAEDPAAAVEPAIADPEILELNAAFTRIADEKTRRGLIAFVETVASELAGS